MINQREGLKKLCLLIGRRISGDARFPVMTRAQLTAGRKTAEAFGILTPRHNIIAVEYAWGHIFDAMIEGCVHLAEDLRNI